MSHFNDSQQPVLQQVTEALQRLRAGPQQPVRETEGRDNQHSPPDSESGEATPPATPPVVDHYAQWYRKMEARSKSTPIRQFQSQSRREEKRLEHQFWTRPQGRRQTLPMVHYAQRLVNAQNNVRSRWVDQGIWGDDWGPAWPENIDLSRPWCLPGGPFEGPYHPSKSKTGAGAAWAHERFDFRSGLEREAETEQPLFGIHGRKPGRPEQTRKRQPLFGIHGCRPERPELPDRPMRHFSSLTGEPLSQPIVQPIVYDVDASRPYYQFMYQMFKERDWIKDEMDYKAPGTAVDLDVMAYQSVRDNWVEDGIWDPKWVQLPGMTWIHEDPEGREPEPSVASSRTTGGGTLKLREHH